MTRPLDRAADTLIAALWWIDRHWLTRCPHCRARLQVRRVAAHLAIDHAGDPEWRDA